MLDHPHQQDMHIAGKKYSEGVMKKTPKEMFNY